MNSKLLPSKLLFVVLFMANPVIFSGCSDDRGHKAVVDLTKPETKLDVDDPRALLNDLKPELKSILSKQCNSCHLGQHKFDSDFDSFEKSAQGGEESEVYKRVVLRKGSEMPMKGSEQSRNITDEERDLIGQYVLALEAAQSVVDLDPDKEAPEKEEGSEENPIKEEFVSDARKFQLQQKCAGCHGPGGTKAIANNMPKLSGLSETYLLKRLKHFKDGNGDAMMQGMVADLNEIEMEYLAQFISSFPQFDGTKSKSGVEDEIQARSASCLGCHNGTPQGFGPNLYGQNKDYLAKQLTDMRTGDREVPEMIGIMSTVTEEEIEKLATHFSLKRKED